MKNSVTVTKSNGWIHFYLTSGKQTRYLFSQKFTKGVYQYFRDGRSENEIKKFNKWNRNPRLDKTIEKIPLYVRYVFREEAA